MNNELLMSLELLINNKDMDTSRVLHQLKNLITRFEHSGTDSCDSFTIQQLCIEMKQIITQGKPNEIIQSGFNNFDKKFGGFLPGELTVVGSRPSMGKTQFLVNLAVNIMKTCPILFFTYDLSRILLTSRFVAAISDIQAGKIVRNHVTKEEKHHLLDSIEKLASFELYINDCCRNSPSSFEQLCCKHVIENNVKVIFVDSLQFMSSNDVCMERPHEIAYIMDRLKSIAKEYNVSLIVTAQLNRSLECRGGSKRPILADFKDSGAIEEFADKVIFLYRPSYYYLYEDMQGRDTKNIMQIIIGKNRNGEVGDMLLKYNTGFTIFSESDMEEMKMY